MHGRRYPFSPFSSAFQTRNAWRLCFFGMSTATRITVFVYPFPREFGTGLKEAGWMCWIGLGFVTRGLGMVIGYYIIYE